MKALLWKDFYQTWKYGKTLLFLSAIFVISSLWVNGSSSMSYLVIYPSILVGCFPYTLLSLDEKEKWAQFCDTLPFTRAQFVSAKYLNGIILGMGISLLTVLGQACRMLISSDSFQPIGLLKLFIILICISMLATSFIMPFVLKLGVERGRLWYMLSLVLFCGLGGAMTAIITFFGNARIRLPFPGEFLFPAATAVVLLFCVGSWKLSIHYYQKREL